MSSFCSFINAPPDLSLNAKQSAIKSLQSLEMITNYLRSECLFWHNIIKYLCANNLSTAGASLNRYLLEKTSEVEAPESCGCVSGGKSRVIASLVNIKRGTSATFSHRLKIEIEREAGIDEIKTFP